MEERQRCEEYEDALVEAFLGGAADEDIESLIECLTPDAPVLPNRTTPLMACILSGRYQYAEKLLEKGAIDAKSPYGSTALTLAASDNTPEGADVVRQLIEAGADVREKDGMGWSPLAKAAFNSQSVMLLEQLFNKGADVNAASKLLITPLMAAAQRKKQSNVFVQWFLDRGAYPNLKTTDGRTAYDFAQEAGNQEAMALLTVTGSWRTLIETVLDAIGALQGAILQIAPQGVMRGGAAEEGPHAPAAIPGMTPLMSAAAEPTSFRLQNLLKTGKDVNARDENGWTALHYALSLGKTQNVVALLGNVNVGADPNVTDGRGIRALSSAIMVGSYDILESLLKGGADPNLPDSFGRTPLFYLLDDETNRIDRAQRDKALKTLLDYRANYDWEDGAGMTPLKLANTKGDGSAEILKNYKPERQNLPSE
jgi:ankyrin repeat protein